MSNKGNGTSIGTPPREYQHSHHLIRSRKASALAKLPVEVEGRGRGDVGRGSASGPLRPSGLAGLSQFPDVVAEAHWSADDADGLWISRVDLAKPMVIYLHG
eukprot:1523282-Pyramimonas_sp.AAC.1